MTITEMHCSPLTAPDAPQTSTLEQRTERSRSPSSAVRRSPSLAVTIVESAEEDELDSGQDVSDSARPDVAPRRSTSPLPLSPSSLGRQQVINAEPSTPSRSSNNAADLAITELPWLHRPPSPCKPPARSSLLERIRKRRSSLCVQEDAEQNGGKAVAPGVAEQGEVSAACACATMEAGSDGLEGVEGQEAAVVEDAEEGRDSLENVIGESRAKPSAGVGACEGPPAADVGSLHPELLGAEALKAWMGFFGMKPASSRDFMVKRLQEIETYLCGHRPAAGETPTGVAAPVAESAAAAVADGASGGRGRGRPRKRPLAGVLLADRPPKATRAEKAAEKAEALEQALADAIRSDTDLYERLLLFEPLEIHEIRDRLARNVDHPELASLGEQRLRNFLDAQGVIFASSWSSQGNRQGRHRRF